MAHSKEKARLQGMYWNSGWGALTRYQYQEKTIENISLKEYEPLDAETIKLEMVKNKGLVGYTRLDAEEIIAKMKDRARRKKK